MLLGRVRPQARSSMCVKTNGGMGLLYRLRHELVFVVSQRKLLATTFNSVGSAEIGPTSGTTLAPTFSSETGERAILTCIQLSNRSSWSPTQFSVQPISTTSSSIPFSASGTTLLAANAHGGVLDPLYVDTVVTRWALDPATSAPGPRANPSMTSEARGARSERPGRSYAGRLWPNSEGDPVEEGAVRKHERQETQTSRCGYGRNYRSAVREAGRNCRKWSCA